MCGVLGGVGMRKGGSRTGKRGSHRCRPWGVTLSSCSSVGGRSNVILAVLCSAVNLPCGQIHASWLICSLILPFGTY
ncbi:hypothetical protein IQ06DRAFT_84231 [Phaeosphaeriaceae sp. SRC1lsM3a]|nr:hypothetical protein IQ06DRAFT_84231 [Stagonospora sp. SRC1lsM3a]